MKQDLHKKSIKLISIMLLAITVMTFNSVSAEDESSMTGQIGHKMQESSNSLQSLDFKRLLNQYRAKQVIKSSNDGLSEFKYLNPKRVKKLLLADWSLIIKNDSPSITIDQGDFILSISDANLDSRGNGSFTYRLYDTDTSGYYADSLGFITNGVLYLASPYINSYSIMAINLITFTGEVVFEQHSKFPCEWANDRKSYTCTNLEPRSVFILPVEFKRL